MELVFRRLESLPDSSEQQTLLDEPQSMHDPPEVDPEELSGMTTDDEDYDDDDDQ